MAFNSITIGSVTFVQTGPGLYQNNTVQFGQPDDLIKIIPGRQTQKNGPTLSTVSRIWQKDIAVGGVTTRQKMTVSLQFSVPVGFTTAEADAMASEISTFITAATLNRILMGES